MKQALFLLAIFSFSAAAQATAVKAEHVSVDLVSEQRSIQPGSSFTLALSFNIEQSWHLYWVNPGDAGLAPTAHWNLPPEVSAGEFEWPYPERMQLGSIVNYVYSGDLLLPISMQVGDLKGKKTTLSADVKWLVCKDVCIPGKATVSLELPVSSYAPQKDPALKAAFAETRSHTPKPLASATRTSDTGPEFIIKIEHLELRAPAQFFPLTPGQVDNSSAPRVVSMGKGMDIYLKKSDQLVNPIQQISGVLVLNDGRSFIFDSPLEQANSKKSR